MTGVILNRRKQREPREIPGFLCLLLLNFILAIPPVIGILPGRLERWINPRVSGSFPTATWQDRSSGENNTIYGIETIG